MLYEVIGLKKNYGTKNALDIPELLIEEGQSYALVGPNGAGKSTLINILGFLIPPSEGIVRYRGKEAFSGHSLVSLRRRVAVLDQSPILFSTSVLKNLEFGLRIRKIPRATRMKRIKEVLEMLGLEGFEKAPGHRLSGGETRRAALAARLVLRPEVLLLDEPTANVDAPSAERIREAVLNANRVWKTTLVIASHDLEWINSLCRHTLHISSGRLAASDEIRARLQPAPLKASSVFHQPASVCSPKS